MINNRLIEERRRRGWDRPEMARRIRSALTGGQVPAQKTILTYVKRWEAGKVGISERYRLAYAAVFKIDPNVLFPESTRKRDMSGNPRGRQKRKPISDPGDEDVNRRTLLQLTSAVGINAAATAAFAASFADLDDALAERASTNADLWQSTTWEYAQKIWVAPPGALIGDLAADVMALGAALKREGRPQVRRELLRASSEICTYMAQEFGDLGDPRQARRCFWRATRAADLSGDRALALWVRGYHAKRMIWENRPPETIAHLLDNAIDSAGKMPDTGLLRAWQAKAEFLADQGDAAGAEAALNTLRDGFTTLPDTVTTDEISARGWSEGQLRFTEAFVYSQLGSARQAHTAIDTALQLLPVQRAGGRTNLKLMRALTLVHEREVKEGLEYAVTTAQSASPTLARQRMAKEIIKALPDAKARAHPAVQHLRTLTTPAPPDPA